MLAELACRIEFAMKCLPQIVTTNKDFGPPGDAFPPITVGDFTWDPNQTHRLVAITNIQRSKWKQKPQTVMKERFVAKSRFGIDGNDNNNKDVVFPVPSVTSIEGPKDQRISITCRSLIWSRTDSEIRWQGIPEVTGNISVKLIKFIGCEVEPLITHTPLFRSQGMGYEGYGLRGAAYMEEQKMAFSWVYGITCPTAFSPAAETNTQRRTKIKRLDCDS
ncbi:hypothetical protein B0H13DRAFT_1853208 [Mycena leptocephala]|nr:hypothetical protein B0H13DRAFT_1853208 [Mycena leptocephala]